MMKLTMQHHMPQAMQGPTQLSEPPGPKQAAPSLGSCAAATVSSPSGTSRENQRAHGPENRDSKAGRIRDTLEVMNLSYFRKLGRYGGRVFRRSAKGSGLLSSCSLQAWRGD